MGFVRKSNSDKNSSHTLSGNLIFFILFIFIYFLDSEIYILSDNLILNLSYMKVVVKLLLDL